MTDQVHISLQRKGGAVRERGRQGGQKTFKLWRPLLGVGESSQGDGGGARPAGRVLQKTRKDDVRKRESQESLVYC